MTEMVGKVTLDLSKYSGSDLYSEGEWEDRLLEIVKNNNAESFNKIIAQSNSWSVLYHLSELRGNIVDFLPVSKNDKVLEVGAGCGAVTGTIADKAKSVTAIELSKKRSLINAYRNKDRDNIEIKVGNFQDIEMELDTDFDYIFLIGVFEYAASYIKAKEPYAEFLNIVLSHLKEGGRLIIAIENKYGLKYFAGCREDHLGTLYSNIMGYPKDSHVKTFSIDRLVRYAKSAGCSVKEFYPYPDYKLPTTIYSQERLPLKGELSKAAPNFDNDRVVAFDEAAAFDEIIEEGKFRQYSNSFLLILEKGIRVESFAVRNPIYSKHSNERSPKYAIRTDIEQDGNNRKYVVKYPMTKEARSHTRSMWENGELLKKQYENTPLKVNKSRLLEGDAVEFEFLSGTPLSDILIRWLIEGKYSKVAAVTDRYVQLVNSLPDMGFANLDLIFSNIMPDGDALTGNWNVIDYEWVVDSDLPDKFVIYRALHYLMTEGMACGVEKAVFEELFERYGIEKNRERELFERELALQVEVAGERISLDGFYSIFGRNAVLLDMLVERGMILSRIDRARAYFDTGLGFSEKEAGFFFGKVLTGDRVVIDIPLPAGTKMVRFDPTEDPCMLELLSVPAAEVRVNGISLGDKKVFFKNPDPQILIDGTLGMDSIHIEYVIRAFDRSFYEPIGEMLEKAKHEQKKHADLFRKKGVYDSYETIRIS